VDLPEERWIKAVELRPGPPETRYVFHHANSSLTASAVGMEGIIYPDDAGQVLRPGQVIDFGMHFFPIDRDVDAVLEVGLWFFPKDAPPRFAAEGEEQLTISQAAGQAPGFPGWLPSGVLQGRGPARPGLVIPPNSIATYRATYRLDKPARIHALRGHMHLRGKYQVVEVVYPDGRYELINKLNWDHAWHTNFVYADNAMPLLPTGTVIILTSVFDNTANNRYNVDPDQWVVAGARTVDEMSHLRLGMTYFENEEDFAELVRERERVLAQLHAQAEGAPEGQVDRTADSGANR
jgi:hypothetical protein